MKQWKSLHQRVTELDAEVGPVAGGNWPRSGFEQAVVVLDAITHTSITDRSDALEPAAADAVAGSSVLLSRLRAVAPEIIDGPLEFDRQSWVCTGRLTEQSRPYTALTPSAFVNIEAVGDLPPSTKPFWVGLHTSTALRNGEGMWEIYLDITKSTLFPRPWYVWAAPARADARIREIPTATAWAEFVSTYPRRQDGLIYPDWRRVARDYDGVHMTLHAVIATQGLQFRVGDAILAAPYYGVESTFWLHWAFQSPELIRRWDAVV